MKATKLFQKTVILFTLGIFLSCNKTDLIPLGQVELNIKDPVEFESGLELEISDVNDSRCPLEVVCVWEGEALVTFDIQFDGQSESIQISKCNGESPQCKDSIVEKLGHRFHVLDVLPFPKIDVEVPDEDYVIIMQIQQL